MQLEPCARCKRHVAVADTRCPFCGAAIVASPPRAPLVGRWSRAAIFAGATTLAACHSKSGATTTTQTTADTTSNDTTTIANDTSQTGPTNVAQPAAGTGTIHGVLVDQNGARIPNMRISLAADGTYDGGRTVTTDARGEFVFADLPPGGYQVIFSMPNNPRQSPNMGYVQVKSGEIAETRGIIYPEPVDTGPCCKPYGAPPARRRLV